MWRRARAAVASLAARSRYEEQIAGGAMSAAASGTSFQALILALQRYWAEQGCVILQPYDVEVGAGTFHPATALRALGPEPWRAAYVQPSRRPTDGRYGENPHPWIVRTYILRASRRSGSMPVCTTSGLSKMIGRARPWAPGGWAGRFGS